MARWPFFAGLTGIIVTVLIVLSHLSRRAMGLDEIDNSRRDANPQLDSDASATEANTGPQPTTSGASSPAHQSSDQKGNEQFCREAKFPASKSEHIQQVDERFEQSSENDVTTHETPFDVESGEQLPTTGPLDDANEFVARTPVDGERAKAEDESKTGRTTDGVTHIRSMSPVELLVNVALSQGLLGVILIGGAWYAEIPLSAFGISLGDPSSFGLPALVSGIVFGGVLFGANELLGRLIDDAGIEYSEGLREMLAPQSLRGWVILLGGVLPVIAGFEEVLFRATLIGALSAGFAISPWLLAIVSSILFAIGHGAQGPGGVLVTGALGFALAGAFVLTGSLLVVITAHYLVNALEFAVHEGLDLDWGTPNTRV